MKLRWPPVRYPVEDFTAEERSAPRPALHQPRPSRLRPRQPAGDGQGSAFCPLFALFRDACAGSTWRSSPPTSPAGGRPFDGEEGERAAGLYERVFVGYGDDSIAQVGGAHVACEWVSNVLTKVLQRGRLAAYLEQSTRYIPYDKPLPDRPAAATATTATTSSAPSSPRRWTSSSRSTRARSTQVEAWAAERWPRGDDEPEGAWQRSIRAKALDLLRGLLPAATLSHVGIYASGQAYEQLILRLMASPLPEAREYGGDDPAAS